MSFSAETGEQRAESGNTVAWGSYKKDLIVLAGVFATGICRETGRGEGVFLPGETLGEPGLGKEHKRHSDRVVFHGARCDLVHTAQCSHALVLSTTGDVLHVIYSLINALR